MNRPRKPTALHKLSGAIQHDPQRFRDRANEPKDDRPLGPPPETMRADQRAAWLEIDRLAPWLSYPDRLAVEVTASLLATFRAMGVGSMQPALLTRLETLLGRLGLTPSDRSRVVARERAVPQAGNAFAGIGKPSR